MYMHKLVGVMHEKGISQNAASKYLGISDVSFRKYLKTNGFTLKQAAELGDLLEIREPNEFMAIFFEKAVA